MRHPCSYMVYSDAFDHLPVAAKQAVYERLWAILSGRDRDPKYAHLSAVDRQAIVDILRDTGHEIATRDGVLFVEDLGSTNGTLVNRRKIKGAIPLHQGDTLQVGRTILEVG